MKKTAKMKKFRAQVRITSIIDVPISADSLQNAIDYAVKLGAEDCYSANGDVADHQLDILGIYDEQDWFKE